MSDSPPQLDSPRRNGNSLSLKILKHERDRYLGKMPVIPEEAIGPNKNQPVQALTQGIEAHVY